MDMSRRNFLRMGAGLSTLAVGASMGGPAFASPKGIALTGVGRCPGDPGAGRLYYGASLPTDLSTWESQLPAHLAVHRTYHQYWQLDLMTRRAKDDLANSRLPHVSIKPPDTWRRVADGYSDQWIRDMGDRLAGVGGPVFLTVHHEPENDAHRPGYHHRGFADMTTRIIDIVGSRAPQVTVVPVLMGWSFDPRSDVDPAAWNVPAAAVYGVDVYNPWSPTNGKSWVTFAERLQAIKPYAQGRPIAIGEYGCRTDPQNPGRAADWMRDAFQYALANNVISMSYFNSGRNSPDGSWALDTERGRVFSASLSSDYVARV